MSMPTPGDNRAVAAFGGTKADNIVPRVSGGVTLTIKFPPTTMIFASNHHISAHVPHISAPGGSLVTELVTSFGRKMAIPPRTDVLGRKPWLFCEFLGDFG